MLLRVKRQSMFVDIARTYDVYIDGKQVGTVSNGETGVFDLTPGHHLIHVKMDWCRSKKLPIDVKPKEAINLHTGNTLKWFLFPFAYVFFITIFRKRYLYLKEENKLNQKIVLKYTDPEDLE